MQNSFGNNGLMWWQAASHDPEYIANVWLWKNKPILFDKFRANSNPSNLEVQQLTKIVAQVKSSFKYCGYLPHRYLPTVPSYFKNTSESCKSNIETALFNMTNLKESGVSPYEFHERSAIERKIKNNSSLGPHPNLSSTYSYFGDTGECSFFEESGSTLSWLELANPEERAIFFAGQNIKVGVINDDTLIALSEFGYFSHIAFSRGVLQRFTEKPWALFGLVAHEMVHLRDGHAIFRAMLSPAFGCLNATLLPSEGSVMGATRGFSLFKLECTVTSGRPSPYCDIPSQTADLAIELMADYGAVMLIDQVQGKPAEYLEAITVMQTETGEFDEIKTNRLACLQALANNKQSSAQRYQDFQSCFREVIR